MIDKETGAYLSEDFVFSQRWRDLSGKIRLHTIHGLVYSYENSLDRSLHRGVYYFQIKVVVSPDRLLGVQRLENSRCAVKEERLKFAYFRSIPIGLAARQSKAAP
jgi:hypothetical protein